MVTVTEEVDPSAPELQSGFAPMVSSKWSYSPLQAIPRNAETLWNLVESVYFSVIPPGHELMDCLTSAISLKDEEASEALPKIPGSGCVRLSYKYGGGAHTTSTPRNSSSFRIDVLCENDSVRILNSDIPIPLIAPPMRSRVAPKPRADQSAATTPPTPGPTWSVASAILECPMAEDESNEIEAELAFLESELSRIRDRKNSMIKDLLRKMESEIRPNKKAWFEAEQNLLALYERKPPSSFQSSGAGGEIKELELSALGKIDSALPDSFKDAELCCCICGEGDTSDENDILICDGCSFAAHQSCYFVQNIPDGSWYCQLCESFFKTKGGRKGSKRVTQEGQGSGLDEYLESTTCSLCLQAGSFVGGGLMKPTSAGHWAHVKCALWVPEAAFPPDGLSITVITNKDRENLRCSLCKQKGGCPVQCAFGRCTSAFHVSCAAKAGLLPEEKNLKNLFCFRHVKIQLKMSPCTSRLLSLRKQDSYMKTMADKYIAPKIGGSLLSPSFSPAIDGEQSFLVQFAAIHPLIFKEIAGPGLIGPQDLMEVDFTYPIMKDFWQEVVSFPALLEGRGGPPEFGKETFIDLGYCSECMRPVSDTRDLIVKCSSCGLLAHALCYDRAGVPVPNVDDLQMPQVQRILKYDGAHTRYGGKKFGCVSITCTRCDMVNSGMVSNMAKTYCMLCMQMGGLLLPVNDADEDDDTPSDETSTGGSSTCFSHPRCIWWLLANSAVSLTSSPTMQLRSIASSYHFHECAVCGSRQGCTVRCARAGCSTRFHVSCGFHAGAYYTVRTPSGVIAGCRDAEDDTDLILDNLSSVLSGKGGGGQSRRMITCWCHEQRGVRRLATQQHLGRILPARAELVRWIPEGIRSEVVSLVNRLLSGEASVGDASSVLALTSAPSATSKRKVDRDSGEVGRKKRGRPLKAETKEKIQTVRFVDGMEVTCEDEDWEGGCSLCGKAWTDSKGQMLESICCDKCDQWYHFSCVGIEKAPSGEYRCPVCCDDG